MGCTATTLLLSFCATTCFCVLTSSDGISVLPSRSDSSTKGKDWSFCYLTICMCSGPLANCQFGHLTYIPTFWDNITQLNFTDNNLHWISNDTFANITHLNLHFLSLAWNKIQNISDDALAELRELKHLDLTGNDLLTPIDLATAFRGLDNLPLEGLTLSGMKLKHVPLNMFHGMKNNVLKYLVLERNHLEEYNQDAFSFLGNIRALELGGNKISSLKWGHAPYLSILSLDGNVITEVPSFCGINSSFYPKLQKLYLEHNLLTETRPHMFKCLPHINILGLNANPIEGIETNTFSELSRLKTIFLKNLKGSKMYIKNHAFNNSNIKRLTMEGSHFTYSDNNVDADSFSDSTGLKSLDLSFSDMYGVNESFFMRLFKDLRGLGGLALGDCKLVSVPDAIPLMLHNLVYLKLFNNRLTFLPKDIFRNLTKLTHLYVDGNKIPEFDEDTFPEKLRNRLRNVNLANNPFSCTCSIRWFLSWVHQDKKKFLQFPYFYKCSSPAY
ncbi:toll-like receptor 3 [Haliotis rufescens]|uniref:toll-like receptor 3 n=1 Tax=Haliotis rufescens TaxID=6454 RepID=UPI00201F37E6|nr:toll-like receptor 3 [Haliotis rufescens]